MMATIHVSTCPAPRLSSFLPPVSFKHNAIRRVHFPFVAPRFPRATSAVVLKTKMESTPRSSQSSLGVFFPRKLSNRESGRGQKCGNCTGPITVTTPATTGAKIHGDQRAAIVPRVTDSSSSSFLLMVFYFLIVKVLSLIYSYDNYFLLYPNPYILNLQAIILLKMLS